MKTLVLLLCLASSAAMAQTYDLTLNLDGNTYAGDFTFTPDTIVTPGGQTIAGAGTYTNVSISDPYGGSLTAAYDIFDGNTTTQHSLWFSNAQGYLVGVGVAGAMGGASNQVTSAIAYTSNNYADNYVSCSVCTASITEVSGFSSIRAPELGAGSAVGAVMLLGCGLLIFKGRNRRVGCNPAKP